MKTTTNTHKTREELAFERMLFFSDAVFAIAITLLAIEIKIPSIQLHGSESELGLALLRSLPKITGFLVSFMLIGQTWIEHHRLCGYMVKHDSGLLWKNLMILLFVAFMPFTTALLSEYFWSRVAICLYAFSFAGLGMAKAFLWRHAVNRNLLPHDLDRMLVARISRRVWAVPTTSIGVIIAAIAGVPYTYVGFIFIPFVALLLDKSVRR